MFDITFFLLFIPLVLLLLLVAFLLYFNLKHKPIDHRKENDFLSLYLPLKEIAEANAKEQKEVLRSYMQEVKQAVEYLNENMSKSNRLFNEQASNLQKQLTVSLAMMQEDNAKKLDQMRETVDEKLQKTLEERISKSFQSVQQNLENVYKAVGEMRGLASGVQDLQKVLSNVKTKGIVGEYQLAQLLEDVLTKDQYETNKITKKGSRDPVEFAVRLPGNADGPIYLPIDSKFPLEHYARLQDAYQKGAVDEIKREQTNLKQQLKQNAKEIAAKYIDVPFTTDFAILFLPTEGLYAEALNLQLQDELQRTYHIHLAGPSTMASLLSSLRLGFRTLAIQKQSNQVWKTLETVKKEFINFETCLEKAQTKMRQASDDLENIVGVRTRQINRALKDVEVLDLPIAEEEE